MSLKNWWRMAYNVCHAPIQRTSSKDHQSNYDVTLMSKSHHLDDILPRGLVKHLLIPYLLW